jgi:hypothetical protein
MRMLEHCRGSDVSSLVGLIQVQFKEVQVMKDIFFAVTIFHSLAAVALFTLMAVTVVNMINNRIQPKG